MRAIVLNGVSAALVAALGLGIGGMASAQRAAPVARLFEDLGGSWSGRGTVALATGTEPIRCRAVYNPASSSRLSLDLRCAGASFTLQVRSEIVREGDRIAGTWEEATFGVSGSLSGAASGNGIRATVAGLGVSAQLSLAVHGDAQTVTLTSNSTFASSATVTLRRS